jgi:uncharacterized protein
MPKTISNTSVLIALAAIDQLDLLQNLFEEIYIPLAVKSEILDNTSSIAVNKSKWIKVHPVKDYISVQLLNEELDIGESEAIILAREMNADILIIDERVARRRASTLEIPTIGTLGVLLMAKEHGLIISIKPHLDNLQLKDFYISDELYKMILHEAGEKD